jgi:hypothetical protein
LEIGQNSSFGKAFCVVFLRSGSAETGRRATSELCKLFDRVRMRLSLSLSLSLLVCILENAKCFGDQYTLIANYEELKDVGDRWCSTSIALQQLLGDEMLW